MSSLVYDLRRRQMLLVEGVPMPAARDTVTRPVRIFRWTDSLWIPVGHDDRSRGSETQPPGIRRAAVHAYHAGAWRTG